MIDDHAAVRLQVERQATHWRSALATLDDIENFASAAAWRALESYLDTAIRRPLGQAVEELKREADVLSAQLRAARGDDDLERVRQRVVAFRRRFLQVETMLDFYGDAVNTRTSPKLGAILRGCDFLASQSLERALAPLGRSVPPVLVYIDKGFGASILRAGLRFWTGGPLSPAAVIKITRHNLGRPTALVHETGHQFAAIVGWNEELAAALQRELAGPSAEVASMWAATASEVAADCFAFAHAGYGSVAALHDVVAGEEKSVFQLMPGDPHPVAFVRVLLGVQMCVRFFGAGPWDELAAAWVRTYPVRRAPHDVRGLLELSVELLPKIVDVCMRRPMRAFGGRSLAALVDPAAVRPDALKRIALEGGAALYTSPHWLHREAVRLLALSGFRAATEPQRAAEVARDFERWMLDLGGGLRLAA